MRPEIGSASHRATNNKAFELIAAGLAPDSRVLDLGAGRGHMARRVARWFEERALPPAERMLAVDVMTEGFQAAEVPYRALDLNEPLPFPDASWDLVYSIEVFEHLRRPYDVLQECHRVLKPGGCLVVSTPNILHLQSRLRFFFTGFFDLYQPPSTDPANAGRLCGHIMPLHVAYYAWGLRRAGFAAPEYAFDKKKGTSAALAALLAPALALTRWRFDRAIRRYDPAVYEETRGTFGLPNDSRFLSSRSLMFTARKE